MKLLARAIARANKFSALRERIKNEYKNSVAMGEHQKRNQRGD